MADGNPNQKLFDAAVRHRIAIERYSNEDAKQVLAWLEDLKTDIQARLVRATPGRRAQLERLLDDVRDIHTATYRRIQDDLTGRWRERAGLEADWNVEKFRSAGVEVAISRLTTDAAYQAALSRPMDGAQLSDWLRSLDSGARNRMNRALTISFTEGESLDRAVKRISDVVEMNKRSARTLVRTANSHIANSVQQASAEANADIVKEVEWRSVLDSRTSPVCFPAETIVQALGSTEGLYRRWYEGKMVVITTAKGHKLRGTPNHPILTASGWLPLHEIQPGEQVFNAHLSEVGKVSTDKNVSVPTSLGAISDALNHPAVSDVSVKRSAPTDFHGDGMGPDEEVDIVKTKGDLRLWRETGIDKHVVHALFGARHCRPFLTNEGLFARHFLSGAPIIQPPEVATVSVEALVEPAFGSAALQTVEDDAGPLTRVEHRNSADLISADKFIKLAPSQVRSDASVLEQGGDGGDGAPVFFCELPGGDAVRVLSDYVVSVRIEDAACHVYNLQTSLGYYIAGGLIVHNCQSRDGQRYPVGEGPRPPAHPGCRSIVIEILDGSPPPQRETYPEWIERQPNKVQDEILGPTRAELLRQGRFKVTEFTDTTGDVIPLTRLKQRPPPPANAVRKAQDAIALARQSAADRLILARQSAGDTAVLTAQAVRDQVTITAGDISQKLAEMRMALGQASAEGRMEIQRGIDELQLMLQGLLDRLRR